MSHFAGTRPALWKTAAAFAALTLQPPKPPPEHIHNFACLITRYPGGFDQSIDWAIKKGKAKAKHFVAYILHSKNKQTHF